jgi:hypothetical protein
MDSIPAVNVVFVNFPKISIFTNKFPQNVFVMSEPIWLVDRQFGESICFINIP